MTERKQVIAAGAFIFDKDKRIFLAKFTKKFSKQWSIPGGKLDFAEGPYEAVIREAKEETNIDIKNVEFFEAGSFVVDHTHVVYVDYLAECPEHYDVQLNEEFSEWGFFDRKSLDTLNIIPKTKETTLAAMRFLSKREWSQKLCVYNLGLIRKTVSLQESQNNWEQAFMWVKQEIKKNTEQKYSIEFIGSTSVPGLLSKPVLDILLFFENEEMFKKDIQNLVQVGFSYSGDGIGNLTGDIDSSRHFFSFYDEKDKIDYVHIHALPKGHPHASKMLKFRDILRSDYKIRGEYTQLKQNFMRQGLSRKEYTLSKDAFVGKILSR